MKAFLGGAKKYIIQNAVFVIFLILIAVLSFVKFAKIDGDSGYFISVPLDKLADFTAMRYQTWTSRNIIEVILVICCHFPLLFALVNVFFCGILYKSIYNVAKHKVNSKQLEFIVATSIIASLAPAALNSAGYIPTIINYLWPVSALAYTIYILKQIVSRKNLLPHQYIFAVLAAILASNSEQCAALLFGAIIVCVGYNIYQYKKNNYKIPKFLFVLLIISIISLAHIAVCPGNALRVVEETRVHFPGFVKLGLTDKILLGFSDIVTDMFAVTHPFYIAAFLILGIAIVYSKRTINCKRNRILLSIPSFTLAGALLFESLHRILMKNYLLTRIPRFAEHSNVLIFPLIMLVCLIVLLSYLVYCFYILSKRNRFSTAVLSIFLVAGILSKVIIGFSPSIFCSAFRTTTPLYIALTFIFCILFDKRKARISKNESRYTYIIMLVAALANVILLFR